MRRLAWERREVVKKLVLALGLAIAAILALFQFRSDGETAVIPSPSVVKGEGDSMTGLAAAERSIDERAPGTNPPPVSVDSNDACVVLVRCEDELGNRIASPVYSLDAGARSEHLECSASDREDELRIDAPVQAVRLGVRAAGFADASVPLPSCPDALVSVRLVKECRLEGRVVRSDGTPPAPCTLVAWPIGVELQPERVDLAFLPSRVLVCQSDADGRFVFRGARGREAYTILGGGSGWMLAERAVRTAAPREDLVLSLDPAYAARVVVHGTDGAPLSLEPGRGASFEFGVLDANLKPMSGRRFEAVLAGLSPEVLRAPSNELFAIVTGRSGGDAAGPCRFSVEAPGYARAEREFTATALHLPLPEVRFDLTPTASQFGSLTVKFVAGESAPAPDRWPSGRLLLTNAAGDATRFRHDGRTSVFEIERLPAGQYSITYESDVGKLRVPAPGAVAVKVNVADGPNSVTFPMSALGWIDFEVVKDRGEPYLGALNVMIGRLATDPAAASRGVVHGMFPCTFEGPPYSVPVSGASTYVVTILSPRRDENLHAAAGDRVEVAVGARVHHLISVKP